MITIEKLKELDGAMRFGSCNSCGLTSIESDSLIRIKASADGKDFSSICLCKECAERFLEVLENI